MSLEKILDKALNTTINVTRETKTVSSIGEQYTSETTAIYSAMPANIQQESSMIEFETEGIVHRQTHRCFLSRYYSDAEVTIIVNDMIADIERSVTYRVVSVEAMMVGNLNISESHHIKLGLEKIA